MRRAQILAFILLMALSAPLIGQNIDALGPDDQIVVRVSNAEDFPDQSQRISPTGFISLPLIGQVHSAGLTVEQLESEITQRLKKYFNAPEVSVTRLEIRSQPVSVIGAVISPGTRQLEGRKTLIDVLSMAGGARDDAGPAVRITRRLKWGRIPLPGAADDPTGQFNVADVPLKDLIQTANPADNILIMPEDVITVPKADTAMVYVIGQVTKSGGIVVGGHEQVTVLQAVSMAGGLSKTANAKESRILRPTPGSVKRDEIPIDLQGLLAGRVADIGMQPNDILVVPDKRGSVMNSVETALRMAASVAILGVRP